MQIQVLTGETLVTVIIYTPIPNMSLYVLVPKYPIHINQNITHNSPCPRHEFFTSSEVFEKRLEIVTGKSVIDHSINDAGEEGCEVVVGSDEFAVVSVEGGLGKWVGWYGEFDLDVSWTLRGL